MEEFFKWPKGYEVKVVRKEDILKCIEDNITDKEVALEIVKHCEINAANFLLEGCWANIPYIGNIRIPKFKQKTRTKEVETLIQDAKETMEPTKYVLFRKKLAKDIDKDIRYYRLQNYHASQAAKKNPKYFNNVVKNRGEDFAKFLMSTLYELEIVSNDNKFNDSYYNE